MSTGFGEEGFGEEPFGDSGEGDGGDSFLLPIEPPFDIYCAHDAVITDLPSHPQVTYIGDSGSAFADFVDNSFVIASGGIYATTDARLDYDTAVPQAFTAEITTVFKQLPLNFSNLQQRHCFLGVFDAQGSSIGLFVSQVGLLYTGVVHFSGDDVVLDQLTQPLPGSQFLVELGTSYTIRLAVSFATGTAYIYWTKTADVESIGHQLRYVLPAFATATSITSTTDRTLFSVRGLPTEPTELHLLGTCLGTGLLIPNLRPVADAGLDQAVRSCAIVQLDGSHSFDPEKAALTYQWRLTDTPVGSQFRFDGFDGATYPLAEPTGFTDRIFSSELEEYYGDASAIGDAISISGVVYSIIATGSNDSGFYVQIDSVSVADDLASISFNVLRQHGVSNPTTTSPTFLPDIPGLYKFDLIVFDGQLYSDAAVTIANVTASPLPRGLIPDVKFLWDYLGDFWRLVEDRARIEVFWSALAQVAASELLTFWQTDYAKSLRDVQRTFQRRWLHYDLLLQESPQLLELSSVRAVYGGISSTPIPTAGVSGVAGRHLDIFLPTVPAPIVVFFTGSDPLTAVQICARINVFLQTANPLILAKVIADRDGAHSTIRIDAPFPISVSGTSTTNLFGVSANAMPSGSGGTVMSARVYRVERSLAQLAVQEGDFLTVGSGTYRIVRVLDAASDLLFYQRVALFDDIPFDAGANWLISGQATSQSLDFYSGLLSAGDVATLEVVTVATGEIAHATVPVTGACVSETGTLGIDASALGWYLALPDTYKVYFQEATRRQYTPIDDLVVDIPYLQELIKNTDDTLVLRRNLDFFIESFRGHKCIRFVVNNDVAYDIWEGLVPPARLWAELTYVDNRPVIEANFGIPAEFTLDDLSQLPDNVDYLSAVRGLWYSYFSGPTLFNLRAGVQILMGLPYAEVESTVEEIRDDFSTTIGRLLLRDVKDTEIVRTYQYPHGLALEINPTTGVPFVVGDVVRQFFPLVKGADVIDYIKTPNWFEGLFNQGVFYEIEKFFKFLVQIDSSAFNLNALLFVRQFVLRIKPTYTLPLFVVREELGDTEVSVSDVITRTGFLQLSAGPYFTSNGQAQMLDQPRPGGGGFWNQFDRDNPNGAAPTSPTPDAQVEWGFDEYLLAPHSASVAKLTCVWAGGVPSTTAGIFYSDMPLFVSLAAIVVGGGIRNITSAGVQVGGTTPSLITGTANRLVIYYRAAGDGATLTWTLKVNGSTVASQTFTPATNSNPDAGQLRQTFTVSVSLTTGDLVSVFISHPTGFNTYVESVGAALGNCVDWSSSVSLGAGTYFTYLVL